MPKGFSTMNGLRSSILLNQKHVSIKKKFLILSGIGTKDKHST